jgi:hypothetical protein
MATGRRTPRRPVPNDTVEWEEVDVSRLAPKKGVVPFRLWTYRVKSSSPDSELFIHDPLAAMVGVVPGVTAESRVTTMVINHDKTLAKFHLFAMALVAAEAGVVVLVLYKLAP